MSNRREEQNVSVSKESLSGIGQAKKVTTAFKLEYPNPSLDVLSEEFLGKLKNSVQTPSEKYSIFFLLSRVFRFRP